MVDDESNTDNLKDENLELRKKLADLRRILSIKKFQWNFANIIPAVPLGFFVFKIGWAFYSVLRDTINQTVADVGGFLVVIFMHSFLVVLLSFIDRNPTRDLLMGYFECFFLVMYLTPYNEIYLFQLYLAGDNYVMVLYVDVLYSIILVFASAVAFVPYLIPLYLVSSYFLSPIIGSVLQDSIDMMDIYYFKGTSIDYPTLLQLIRKDKNIKYLASVRKEEELEEFKHKWMLEGIEEDAYLSVVTYRIENHTLLVIIPFYRTPYWIKKIEEDSVLVNLFIGQVNHALMKEDPYVFEEVKPQNHAEFGEIREIVKTEIKELSEHPISQFTYNTLGSPKWKPLIQFSIALVVLFFTIWFALQQLGLAEEPIMSFAIAIIGSISASILTIGFTSWYQKQITISKQP